MFTVIRKIRSLLITSCRCSLSIMRVLKFRLMGGVEIPWDTFIGKDVFIQATDGAHIKIGKGTQISTGVHIVAEAGRIIFGTHCFVGAGSMIISKNCISIGDDLLIAEYVVIRDQDHAVCVRPIRSAGFTTAAIQIGHDVWIGSKATILRGVSIGNGAVVGAHALVNNDVQPSTLVVGVPAHSVKKLSGTA